MLAPTGINSTRLYGRFQLFRRDFCREIRIAPGNTMFYGLEHMRLRYHSYMFDGRFGSEDTPSGGHILDVFYTCSSVQTIMLCLPLL